MLGYLGPSRGCLEASWRSVGGYLEPCLAILGHFEGHLGLSRALLEPSWANKGGVEGLWERLGGLLGPSWAPWLKKRGGLNSHCPHRRLSNGVLGPSWSALGRLLGDIGAVFGLLELLLGPFWAIMVPS